MLKLKDKVVISGTAGLAAKFPAFVKGFIGKHGVIVSFWKHNATNAEGEDLVEVQLDSTDTSQRVWTRRDWLTSLAAA